MNWSTTNEVELTRLYNEKFKKIESGVNTYSLAETFTGRSEPETFTLRAGRRGEFPVRLGSGIQRDFRGDGKVGAGCDQWQYRLDLPDVEIPDSLTNSRWTSTHFKNPIVAFSAYAAANPYYKKYNDEGTVDKWLEYNDYFKASNPL